MLRKIIERFSVLVGLIIETTKASAAAKVALVAGAVTFAASTHVEPPSRPAAIGEGGAADASSSTLSGVFSQPEATHSRGAHPYIVHQEDEKMEEPTGVRVSSSRGVQGNLPSSGLSRTSFLLSSPQARRGGEVDPLRSASIPFRRAPSNMGNGPSLLSAARDVNPFVPSFWGAGSQRSAPQPPHVLRTVDKREAAKMWKIIADLMARQGVILPPAALLAAVLEEEQDSSDDESMADSASVQGGLSEVPENEIGEEEPSDAASTPSSEPPDYDAVMGEAPKEQSDNVSPQPLQIGVGPDGKAYARILQADQEGELARVLAAKMNDAAHSVDEDLWPTWVYYMSSEWEPNREEFPESWKAYMWWVWGPGPDEDSEGDVGQNTPTALVDITEAPANFEEDLKSEAGTGRATPTFQAPTGEASASIPGPDVGMVSSYNRSAPQTQASMCVGLRETPEDPQSMWGNIPSRGDPAGLLFPATWLVSAVGEVPGSGGKPQDAESPAVAAQGYVGTLTDPEEDSKPHEASSPATPIFQAPTGEASASIPDEVAEPEAQKLMSDEDADLWGVVADMVNGESTEQNPPPEGGRWTGLIPQLVGSALQVFSSAFAGEHKDAQIPASPSQGQAPASPEEELERAQGQSAAVTSEGDDDNEWVRVELNSAASSPVGVENEEARSAPPSPSLAHSSSSPNEEANAVVSFQYVQVRTSEEQEDQEDQNGGVRYASLAAVGVQDDSLPEARPLSHASSTDSDNEDGFVDVTCPGPRLPLRGGQRNFEHD